MDKQTKPALAYGLSLAAGILIVIGATLTLIFITADMLSGDTTQEIGWECKWTEEKWDCERDEWSRFPGNMPALTLPFGIAGLFFGGIVIYSSIMLNSKPARHVIWGILIIIFSLLSVIGAWGGFGIGLVLGVIGGVLALSWQAAPKKVITQAVEPIMYEPPEGELSTDPKFCIHCGRQVPFDAKFCSHCGKRLPE